MLLRSSLYILFLFAFPLLQAETTLTPDELEKWFLSDELAPPSQSSDSHLIFIAPPTDKNALHSINKIIISPESLKTGWVSLLQCYKHLDPVADMEVVYNYKTMRNMSINKARNIEHVEIKGASVQLKNVLKNAQLCVQAEMKIFHKKKDGSYLLKNGSFHRQFLDGYFPFHLTMEIYYPSTQLKFISSKPKPQFGFVVKHTNNSIRINSYFTGKLYTEMTFKTIRGIEALP